METVPYFTPGQETDQGSEGTVLTPLSKEEVITAVTQVLGQRLRERQGLPPELDPQVTRFIDTHF